MRLFLRVAAMAALLLLLLPLHFAWRISGRESPWPHFYLRQVASLAGLRFNVVGAPLRSHVLFVSNHVSWTDIVVIAAATGAAFVSKAEMRRVPLIGWLASLNNTVFVARERRGAVREQADALRDALSSGQPVALFPEGSTDGGGRQVLPFRASLLQSLFPPLADVQVQPVALDYGAATDEVAWLDPETGFAHAVRTVGRKGTHQVTLHFLDPIDPAAAGDRKRLAAQARDAIVARLSASASAGD